MTAGTPKYLAPERLPVLDFGASPATLHMPDRRSDVWSLGVCLFEFLTLTSAFEGATSAELYRAVATLDVPSPRSRYWMVPQALEDVCRVSTHRNPDQRYVTAGEMADALDAFVQNGAHAKTHAGRDVAALAMPSGLANNVLGWLKHQLLQFGVGKGVRR